MSTTAIPERTKKLMDIWDRMKTNSVGFYELENLVNKEIKLVSIELLERIEKEVRDLAQAHELKVGTDAFGYHYGICSKLASLKQELTKKE